jgi:hypothetical protein
MSWDDNTDRDAHPAWCFCTECGGGGKPDAELDDAVDTTVTFIKKMVRDTTRTVLQVHRRYNHYERNYDMSFYVGTDNGGGGGRNNARAQRQKGLPFLDPQKDLGADKRRVKILWAGDPKEANVHAEWARVTLKLESINSKARRLWTLGGSNPSLDVLVNALGNDAHQWVNRELWMWCDTNNPSETPFVRMEIIPTDESVQTATAAPGNAGSM